MDIIPIQCPHCLGELEVNWDAGTAICLYCRGKMVIKRSFDPTKSPHANPMTAKQLSLTHLAVLLKKISQSVTPTKRWILFPWETPQRQGFK